MARRETFQGGQRARELFDQGMGCNEIARELGVGAATISRWAKSESLSFDRSATAIAVQARVIDIAESRTLLVQKMLTVAHEALDNLDGPYLVYNFGGSENTYKEHLLDSPPIEVVRVAQTVAKDAFFSATRMLEKDNGGLEGTVGVLDALAGNLSAAAAMLRAQDDVAPGDADGA